MILLLTGIALILAGGIGALLLNRTALSSGTALIGCMSGGICVLITAIRVLLGVPVTDLFLPGLFSGHGFHLSIDPLSAFFMLPVALIGMTTVLYGYAYVKPSAATTNNGLQWLWCTLLIASMLIVVCARNVLTFLSGWEIMSLTSFFLVIANGRSKTSAQASWVYCVATHIGTAFLLLMFVRWGRTAASFEFSDLSAAVPAQANGMMLILIFGLIGFGTKAGIAPLHTWLPQAHATAPSHISAIMSGVMIKMGIYGIIRLTLLTGQPLWWWGPTLMAVGVVTALLGVLMAIGQSDIKRVLAYCSVENIGIICMGLGLGVWGRSHNLPFVSLCGYAGALLHIINHAFFKSLLFMGAGAVIQQTHCRSISMLGGLIKKMPRTSWLFGLGSAAICGLPPLNGFVSELLIFVAGFSAILSATGTGLLGLAGTVAALGLTGGLALVCFTRLYGIAFLGEPRTNHVSLASEPARPMVVAMAITAAGCVAIGLLFFLILPLVAPAILQVSQFEAGQSAHAITMLTDLCRGIAGGTIGLSLLIGGLFLARRLLLNKRKEQGLLRTDATWGCGYGRPGARMQYTASSFAQPVVELFASTLKPSKEYVEPVGFFPTRHGFFDKQVSDRILDRFLVPLFNRTEQLLGHLRWLQAGRVQLYILYIAITIVLLFIWKFGWMR